MGKCGINASARHQGGVSNDHCVSFDYFTIIAWNVEGTRNAWSHEVNKALATSNQNAKNQKPNVGFLLWNHVIIIDVLMHNIRFTKKYLVL